ncbi:hypothetical protein [Micromonospora sp. NPDC049900]
MSVIEVAQEQRLPFVSLAFGMERHSLGVYRVDGAAWTRLS